MLDSVSLDARVILAVFFLNWQTIASIALLLYFGDTLRIRDAISVRVHVNDTRRIVNGAWLNIPGAR